MATSRLKTVIETMRARLGRHRFPMPGIGPVLVATAFLTIPVFGYLLFRHATAPSTLDVLLSGSGAAGEAVIADFRDIPAAPLEEEEGRFIVTDGGVPEVTVSVAGPDGTRPEEAKSIPDGTRISFPKDYAEPVEIDLGGGKTITMFDASGSGRFRAETVSVPASGNDMSGEGDSHRGIDRHVTAKASAGDASERYLSYSDDRKTILYAYRSDGDSGRKVLKSWTVYEKGDGTEEEKYVFGNATLSKNISGEIEIRYRDERDVFEGQDVSEVDPSLLDRARRTLAKEAGSRSDDGFPDLVIPKPYFVDGNGETHGADWTIGEDGRTLTLSVSVDPSLYPIALDPTVSFVAPGSGAAGDMIYGSSGESLGFAVAVGDFDRDGLTDFAVGAPDYSSSTGRVYLFYGDGAIPVSSGSADAVLTGAATGDHFGHSLAVGDFDSDGKEDLAVGASDETSGAGKVYVFYQGDDGFPSLSASSADVAIAGESGSHFGSALVSGDFDADARTDLAVAADEYSSYAGRVYVFYNDGSYPSTAASADETITGESSSYLGSALVSGDFDRDGLTDLAVGGPGYSSSTGRAYVFYNDGSYPSTAASADIVITGDSGTGFGAALVSGDFDADGTADLAVGGPMYSSWTGRAYIFHNDGSVPTSAASADVTITGESSSQFGMYFAAGDFDGDGRTDLVVGAPGYSSDTGRAYVFYNDGSYPPDAYAADAIADGQGGRFGAAIVSGDLNADGRTDLVVGADQYSSDAGRVYVLYSQNGILNENHAITGGVSGENFGSSVAFGDFDSDGRTDLAIGAVDYSTSIGRTYIFYNDGTYPTTSSSADHVITGESQTYSYFGYALAVGDLDADGDDDLAVGADGYEEGGGRGSVYIFYNDGSYPSSAADADEIIRDGYSSEWFGGSIAIGDLDADGDDDLAVGSWAGYLYIFYNDGSYPSYSTAADDEIGDGTSGFSSDVNSSFIADMNADGRDDILIGSPYEDSNDGGVYIFYNDGSYPSGPASADVMIGGTSGKFGFRKTVGDFDGDGKTDIAVGAPEETVSASNDGKVYVFYQGEGFPSTLYDYDADVTISGQAGNQSFFGRHIAAGDFDADGDDDFVVTADEWGTSNATGRAYVFYNDGSYPDSVDSADVVITAEYYGNHYFGWTLATGDFDNDGTDDIIAGTGAYSSNTGKVYFFSGQGGFVRDFQESGLPGSFRVTPGVFGQELRTTGESSGDDFGYALSVGDFDSDGKDDLAVGAPGYSSDTGRAYIFYADGTLPLLASGADVVLSGATSGDDFGFALMTGDFDSDGKDDLAVGAPGYSSDTGRTYVFFQDSAAGFGENVAVADADVTITGESSSDFGSALAALDFDFDGRVDLIAGAPGYSSDTGRVYVFGNDGSYPTSAASADLDIVGESSGDLFGASLVAGDFDGGGRSGLAVGAPGYSSDTGRAYIFYGASLTVGGSTSTETYAAPGSDTWEVPSGVTSATVRLWGGGGAGGGASSSNYSNGGGGAGGQYAEKTLSVSSGQTYTVVTAASVAGDTDGGATGNDSYFYLTSGNNLCVAKGGAGGTTGVWGSNGQGGTGSTTNGVGDTVYRGGNGATGSVMTYGGGGGGGAGTTGNGGGASGSTGGSGTTLSGGDGGDGFDTILGAGNGDPGSNYGGGGGGGSSYSGGAVSGGAGAQGYAEIEYTLPGSDDASSADVIITGESGSSFGVSFVAGDFDRDGSVDLAVGAPLYSSSTGRVYVFENDGTYPTTAATADTTITGESGSSFGSALVATDYDGDGRTDIVAGATGYSSSTGRAYVFENDGAYPSTAASADASVLGESTGDFFGHSLATGDFDADGKADLAVGAYAAASNGRTYVYTFDDSRTTGESSGSEFGYALVSGDLDFDGDTDLAVGAPGYSSSAGRVYIFYGKNGLVPDADSADVTITGESSSDFGSALAALDFDFDGRVDLIAGAPGYSSDTGRVYVFGNDGSYPTSAASADLAITGETGSRFGTALASGPFDDNAAIDLIVGAPAYSSSTGRAYIFGNDTSATSATGADVTLTGESSSSFGSALVTGDFNTDGSVDLAVGAPLYSSSTGRAYVFENDGYGGMPTTAATADTTITGESGSSFGSALAAGDLDADGDTDLAVGAPGYSSDTGRAYIFGNDGSYPTTAADADTVLTGESGSSFGTALIAGDFDRDGDEDLVVGAPDYSSSLGRAYLFGQPKIGFPTIAPAASADMSPFGGSAGEAFGFSAFPGDFDGDGKIDLAVGAPDYSSSTGRVYIIITEVRTGEFETLKVRGTVDFRGSAEIR